MPRAALAGEAEARPRHAGRNYIEEEKRVARNFGFYSGFDT